MKLKADTPFILGLDDTDGLRCSVLKCSLGAEHQEDLFKPDASTANHGIFAAT